MPATCDNEQTIDASSIMQTSKADGNEMKAVAIGMTRSPAIEYTSLVANITEVSSS